MKKEILHGIKAENAAESEKREITTKSELFSGERKQLLVILISH